MKKNKYYFLKIMLIPFFFFSFWIRSYAATGEELLAGDTKIEIVQDETIEHQENARLSFHVFVIENGEKIAANDTDKVVQISIKRLDSKLQKSSILSTDAQGSFSFSLSDFYNKEEPYPEFSTITIAPLSLNKRYWEQEQRQSQIYTYNLSEKAYQTMDATLLEKQVPSVENTEQPPPITTTTTESTIPTSQEEIGENKEKLVDKEAKKTDKTLVKSKNYYQLYLILGIVLLIIFVGLIVSFTIRKRNTRLKEEAIYEEQMRILMEEVNSSLQRRRTNRRKRQQKNRELKQ
ncbi:MAG: hypothetical protein LBV67_00120 [Streptococcaceae bacterium]|jgi:uncharacterized membrane protein|nr:hypothetical protein [Streptococcaceae bacterium]